MQAGAAGYSGEQSSGQSIMAGQIGGELQRGLTEPGNARAAKSGLGGKIDDITFDDAEFYGARRMTVLARR